jgi:replication factor C subunit 1
VCGGGAEEHWKYKMAVEHKIPLVSVSSLTLPSYDLWADVYKPKAVVDVIGHGEAIKGLCEWLTGWSTEGRRGALLTGPPGIGKTTVAHLVAEICGYTVIELNASNERSAGAVRKWFEEAAGSHHVGERRVVIMDEVDGMSRGDRGGIGELARVLRMCVFPVICIANEKSATSPRMRPLVSVCVDVRFHRPRADMIAKRLMKTVVAKQGLKIKLEELVTLCEQTGNDIRHILNFLQFAAGGGVSSKDELLNVDIFSATGKLFHTGVPLETRSSLVFSEFGMIPLMVAEGYVGAAAKGRGGDAEKLTRCVEAANHLGMWDILDRRIRSSQAWALMPAAVNSVVAAAGAAGGPAPFQIFPQWLGKMSKRSKHMRWDNDIRARTGIANEMGLLDTRSVYRARLFAAGQTPGLIVDKLLEYGLTRDDMMEALTDTAFVSGDVTLDSKVKAAVTREFNKRAPAVDTVRVDMEDDIDTDSDVDEDRV